jgi:Raf kinase inhibitor-like YbhB/YbcL family protein
MGFSAHYKNSMIRQTTTLTVSSPEFGQGDRIPSKYTADGEGVNPPLEISGIPGETRSIALILEDPDAPQGTYTHWLSWDIIGQDSIREDSAPGVQGLNSEGSMGYIPPDPPAGAHRYLFHVYALDHTLDLRPGSDRKSLETAMKGHILLSGTLMGRYEKKKGPAH